MSAMFVRNLKSWVLSCLFLSSAIGYTASITEAGSVSIRSNASAAVVSPDILNVKSYGALGDGVTDDSRAFTAINSESAKRIAAGKNVAVYFPPGHYKTGVPLQIVIDNPQGSFTSIRGEGGSSVIEPLGTYSGVDLEIKSGDAHFNVSDLVVSKVSGRKGGEAVEIHSYTGPMGQGRVRNINCENMDRNGNRIPFHSCIHLRNVIRTDVSSIKNMNAGTGFGSPDSGIGIWLDGTDNLYTVDNHIHDIQQTNGFAYVAMTGHVEGATIDALTGLYAAYGIYAPGRSWLMTPAGSKNRAMYPNTHLLWVTLTNSHIATYFRGVYAVSSGAVKVANDLFFNAMLGSNRNIVTPDSDGTPYLPLTTNMQGGGRTRGYSYIGIDLVNAGTSHVYANEIQCAGAQASTGISVSNISYGGRQEDTRNNFIFDNGVFGSTGDSVVLGAGVKQTVIHDNVANGAYNNRSSDFLFDNNLQDNNFGGSLPPSLMRGSRLLQ